MTLPWTVAVIGAVIGWYAAVHHANPTDRNAGVVGAIIGGVIFYNIAYTLLNILILGLVGGFLYLWWLQRNTVHEVLVEFAKNAGVQFYREAPKAAFRDRLNDLHSQHIDRVDAIDNVLSGDDCTQAVEIAEGRFVERVKEMTRDDY